MTVGGLIYAFALATALALALVYQSAAMRKVGYRLQDLRAEIAEEQAERSVYQAHLSKLKNPERVMRLVAWLRLDLREPPVAPARPASDGSETGRSLAAESTGVAVPFPPRSRAGPRSPASDP